MMLPLLDILSRSGGRARPGEIYDRIAERLGVSDAARKVELRARNGRRINVFERTVRWTRQTAVCKELIVGPERGLWELTDKARASLRNAAPGTIVTVFETENGVALWASAEDAIGVIDRESVQLLFCSPPYPIVKAKPYGGMDERTWLDWMLDLCDGWRELLTSSGSMVINLGTAWKPGLPAVSLYMHRFILEMHDKLGMHLCQDLYWHSPSKFPGPMPWTVLRRIRVKSSLEALLWFSADPMNASADNRRVLSPYTASGLRSMRNASRTNVKRPSGIAINPRSFATDHGGSIPSNVIIAANSGANDAYHRAQRAAGDVAHPATMPVSVAEFVIKLLTEERDLVYDPLAGSGTTAEAAEKLDRRWIINDRSLTYLRGASRRFPTAIRHVA